MVGFTALMGLLPQVTVGRVALRADVTLPMQFDEATELVGVVVRGPDCAGACEAAEQSLAELVGMVPGVEGVVVSVGPGARPAPQLRLVVAAGPTRTAWADALGENTMEEGTPIVDAGHVYLLRRADSAWDLRAVLRGPTQPADLVATASRLVGAPRAHIAAR